MTNKTYSVSLETQEGTRRDVTVLSPTGVQAGDAASPLMVEGDSIVEITEVPENASRDPDGGPPKSQAAELAPVTPGAAAAPQPANFGDADRG